MTRTRPILLLAGVGAIALAAGACSGGGSTSAASGTSPTTVASSGPPATVKVASSGLGNILVDSQGRTLYLFLKDAGTTSSCTDACATAWPPLRDAGTPTAGSGADASMLGTVPRTDGAAQITYNGHPLYTFTADSKAGDTNGQGKNAFGALWYVVSPAGTQITTTATTAASSSGSGSSGGGGY
jgi:predicted lipoprotein with Yx(FWY)xxD motif